MNDAGKPEKRRRAKRLPSWADHDRLEELELEFDRLELLEEQRLINIARKAGYFDYHFRNREISEMFRQCIRANPERSISKLDKLTQRLSNLKRTPPHIKTRRKLLLGKFLTAECRHSNRFHRSCVPDIRDWILSIDDIQVATRYYQTLKAWFRDPGTETDDPGSMSPADERRAYNHRMILLGEWIEDRRDTFPVLAERIDSWLPDFVDEDPVTADHKRMLLADLIS